MKKYKSITEYLSHQIFTREGIKEDLLQSSLLLLNNCAHLFNEDATMVEKVALPLYYLNEILDEVE